ncbi:MAG TPA: hypothetical protein VKT77_00155 [Chthonomonadaceae bacterium]|nr:hypothetical protein [Chthonomonadaceae bacterium]
MKAHPKGAEGYFTLGRINAAAFARDTGTLGVYQDEADRLPRLPFYTGVVAPRTETKPPSGKSLTFLADALRSYRTATALDPNKAVAFLGLGFEYEEALRFSGAPKAATEALALPPKTDAEALRRYALDSYRMAYRLTIDTDLKSHDRFDKAVSQEAAEGFLRLQQGRKLTAKGESERTALQATIDKLRRMPRVISPILISFDRSADLSDLLAPGSAVHFNLAGRGKQDAWPWLKPTTGILVWDPKHTGKITSGLQLFGNVTWWMFWKDGYGPLDALDDDRNGWLEGKELKELAVWFDRNGNGVSDPGEVVPLASLHVVRIAVRPDGLCDGVPCRRQGVQLADGSYAATFDWTPTALSDNAGSAGLAGRPGGER